MRLQLQGGQCTVALRVGVAAYLQDSAHFDQTLQMRHSPVTVGIVELNAHRGGDASVAQTGAQVVCLTGLTRQYKTPRASMFLGQHVAHQTYFFTLGLAPAVANLGALVAVITSAMTKKIPESQLLALARIGGCPMSCCRAHPHGSRGGQNKFQRRTQTSGCEKRHRILQWLHREVP